MDNAGYTTLTRQAGLLREMQTVANNIANLSTAGYRAEGVIFAEYVRNTAGDAGALSMATGDVRKTDLRQGQLTQTGGTFDLAIEGPGFFMVETAQGPALTRAGAFTPNEAGELVNPEGHHLLDAGGSPLFIPPDATAVSIAPDGTISADSRVVGQVGLYQPSDPLTLTRQSGTLFISPSDIDPAPEGSAILQGYIEGSNVDPITQVARMIEVQHAYELGQSFLEREDERIRAVVRTLGQ